MNNEERKELRLAMRSEIVRNCTLMSLVVTGLVWGVILMIFLAQPLFYYHDRWTKYWCTEDKVLSWYAYNDGSPRQKQVTIECRRQ